MAKTFSRASTLNKKTLSRYLEKTFGLEKAATLLIVESFFEEIAIALAQHQRLNLTGWGTFSVKRKKARPGRHINRGETVFIESRNRVKFEPSKQLRKKILSLS